MPKKSSVLSGSKIFNERRNEASTRKLTRTCKKNGLSRKVVEELFASRKFYKSAHQRMLQCLNSNDSLRKKYTMAVEFDHLYIDCGDSKSPVSRDIKIQGLKDLNLIHLDLIQQQAEHLVEKDKIIKALKQENQSLTARVEKITRQLDVSSKQVEYIKQLSVDVDVADEPTVGLPPDGHVSSRHQAASPKASKTLTRNHNQDKETWRHSSTCSSPSPPPRVSPRERRSRRQSTQNDTEPVVKIDEPSSDALQLTTLPHPEQVTDHSLRSRDRNKESVSPQPHDTSTNSSPKIIDVPASPTSIGAKEVFLEVPLLPFVIDDNIASKEIASQTLLSCEDAYFISSPTKSPSIYTLCQHHSQQQQVELPRWRVRSLSSQYIMEGTENLEDDIFLKRHSKPENEERRRKRWDLQRMREQRQYEKLRERYEERNNPTDTFSGSHVSLWPSYEGAHFVQVLPSLPICAFGQQLPNVKPAHFSIPWMEQRDSRSSLKKRKTR